MTTHTRITGYALTARPANGLKELLSQGARQCGRQRVSQYPAKEVIVIRITTTGTVGAR